MILAVFFLFEWQPLQEAYSCAGYADANGSYLLKLSLPLTLLQFLVGCVILPLFLQNIGGPSKLYMIWIQVASVLYISFTLTPLMIRNHMRDRVNSDGLALSKMYLEEYHLFALVQAGDILRMFFYYLHYGFMLLQCANYRQMICDPLHFADFIKTKKIVIRILVTLILAALAVTDDVVFSILRSSEISNIVYISQKVVIYAMCESSAFRVVHLCVMIKMAHDIRQSLREGRRMLEGTDRSPIFIAVAVVPIIISTLCHAVETCIMLVYFFTSSDDSVGCNNVEEAIKNHIEVPTVSATHLIASLANCCTYLICFPKLRENPCFAAIFRRGQAE